MSKHKALELADVMDCLSATQRNSDNAASRSAAELRAQHALIVQMREALANFGITVGQRYTCEGQELLDALAAADQYLGEQA